MGLDGWICWRDYLAGAEEVERLHRRGMMEILYEV